MALVWERLKEEHQIDDFEARKEKNWGFYLVAISFLGREDPKMMIDEIQLS